MCTTKSSLTELMIYDKEKQYFFSLPSVSGVLLRGVQLGFYVKRWVCQQVRMWLDTTVNTNTISSQKF